METKKQKYKTIFIEESREELDELNRALVELEKHPDRVEIIDTMFRLTHTLKGNAAAMDEADIANLTHKIEDVFVTLRNRKNILSTELADTLYRSFDAIGTLLKVEKEETGKTVEVDKLLPELERALEGLKPQVESLIEGQVETARIELADTIKVSVKKLDQLMNLVGELMIDGSRIKQMFTDYGDSSGKEVLSHFGHIINEIQDGVMGIRMEPIGSLFSKFPRLIRDLARAEGKEVDLMIEGEEIEVDRSLLEKLGDALLHLIRNAVDHGIETPEQRESKNKDPKGLITLSASREQQQITIEVRDDGHGIDVEQVVNEATARGLASKEELSTWRHEDILALLCEPGFSFAKNTTEVSGRGIGMDVVKRSVDALSGNLLIRSAIDVGTSIRIKMPPSIVVIRALLFYLDAETYAIPLQYISRITTITNEDIHLVGETYLTTLDGESIPVIFLRNLLIAGGDGLLNTRESIHNIFNLVVSEVGDRFVGIIVGELGYIQDLVIKPLGRPVSNMGYILGATILGKGELCIILDISGLLRTVSLEEYYQGVK